MITFYFVCLLSFCTLASSFAQAIDYEEKAKGMGIEIKRSSEPLANYLKAVRSGNLVFLSGHAPRKQDGSIVTGKVGADLTAQEGYEASRLATIELLSSLKSLIGDLNRVERIVKVTGMINSTDTFDEHSKVLNGCSDLLVAVFGEQGKHARSAVGMASLPLNMAVEIEMIVALKE